MDYIYHSWTYPMFFTGHCSCTCFTCLYKLDLLLLLIVIYLLLMDKITINIDTSTYRLPLMPVNDNLTGSHLNMSNVVSSTTGPISLSPSPWDSMLISERSTPSDPPESLPESINSFGSSGSIRRKLIKPDISLDFLDSSSSSEEEESDSEIGGRFEACNVFSGCTNDEHFYRDTSLSEETFTNDRIPVKLVSNSQPVDNQLGSSTIVQKKRASVCCE